MDYVYAVFLIGLKPYQGSIFVNAFKTQEGADEFVKSHHVDHVQLVVKQITVLNGNISN